MFDARCLSGVDTFADLKRLRTEATIRAQLGEAFEDIDSHAFVYAIMSRMDLYLCERVQSSVHIDWLECFGLTKSVYARIAHAHLGRCGYS